MMLKIITFLNCKRLNFKKLDSTIKLNFIDFQLIQFQFIHLMPIILNEEEDSLKYNLLNQSIRDQLNTKHHHRQRYSNQKYGFPSTKNAPKSQSLQISDWNSNSVFKQKDKPKYHQFILPKMKINRKSKNIEDLSRQLLKYQQHTSEQNDQKQFRLTILKQMTKINLLKQKPKKIQSPKKIDIKLEFPQRYQKYLMQSQDKQFASARNSYQNDEKQFMTGSFYTRRSNHGLIPSMRKLSSFPKKSMYRSESQRDSHQHKKFIFNTNEWKNVNQDMPAQIQQNTIAQQKQEEQKKIKFLVLQKRFPLKFLNLSNRKQSIQIEQVKLSPKKTARPPFLMHMSTSSYDVKSHKSPSNQSLQQRILSDCIFLNVSKKKYTNK